MDPQRTLIRCENCKGACTVMGAGYMRLVCPYCEGDGYIDACEDNEQEKNEEVMDSHNVVGLEIAYPPAMQHEPIKKRMGRPRKTYI